MVLLMVLLIIVEIDQRQTMGKTDCIIIYVGYEGEISPQQKLR